MSEDYKPFNQHSDPQYNREAGIVVVPGSNYAKEMTKFEQFPSKYTAGSQPGNPYRYRPFPKMLYRAQHWNGARACMAAPPDPVDFRDPRDFERAEEAARKFTEKCQRIVQDESEYQKAFEDSWRESPKEAIEALEARDRGIANATAERNWQDRNMGEQAKLEAAEAVAAVGGEHLPEIVEKSRRGRRSGRRASLNTQK